MFFQKLFQLVLEEFIKQQEAIVNSQSEVKVHKTWTCSFDLQINENYVPEPCHNSQNKENMGKKTASSGDEYVNE